MSTPTTAPRTGLPPEDQPCLDHVVTEDDTPVDGIFSEKQMRLLVEALYSSWIGPGEGRPFIALANVGLFFSPDQPPLVPDVMLSLDVQLAGDMSQKRNRSYFIWVLGKPPDVVVEVVSNKEGGEASHKLKAYARLGISYYVIYDPDELLGGGKLSIHCLHARSYHREETSCLADVGLGLTIWRGRFEGLEADWLRWCDETGNLIPTGAEQAEQEKQRANRMAEKLRQLGVDPGQ